MSEETEILPCPFCGRTGEVQSDPYWHDRNGVYVECPHCAARGPWVHGDDEGEAIDLWNERMR